MGTLNDTLIEIARTAERNRPSGSSSDASLHAEQTLGEIERALELHTAGGTRAILLSILRSSYYDAYAAALRWVKENVL